MSSSPSCARCKCRILRDDGYSNYTVESTSLGCVLGLNPSLPVEEPLNTDVEESAAPFDFAATCARYEEGGALAHFEVEDDIPSHLSAVI